MAIGCESFVLHHFVEFLLVNGNDFGIYERQCRGEFNQQVCGSAGHCLKFGIAVVGALVE